MLKINFTIVVGKSLKNNFAAHLDEIGVRVDRVMASEDGELIYFNLGADRKTYIDLLDWVENDLDDMVTLVQ